MGMNNTPTSDRIHIGIFGKTNSGKSSIINAITGQSLAIVSDVKGTTTDPVFKSMELLPLGPVVIIDTPGIDDLSQLGKQRIQKTYQIMNKTDIGILVVDGSVGLSEEDKQILNRLKSKNIPYLIVLNKSDLVENLYDVKDESYIWVSAAENKNIYELKEKISQLVPNSINKNKIVSDIVNKGDYIILVVPIDEAAPKGRLILPQQQTIRDALQVGAIPVVCKDTELEYTLNTIGVKPKMVITDSQAFKRVSMLVPKDIMLTSFSILMAKYKGNLQGAINGVIAVKQLNDGDFVLISEGCTHHRQCNDIGTVKIPNWIKEFIGKDINFEFTSGGDFPLDLSKYKAVVHCGGCTLNEREMKYREGWAKDQNVPMTNYGLLIAYINGILERSLEPLNIKL